MKNVDNLLKDLTERETQRIFGGTDKNKNHVLPKFVLPKEKVSASLKENMYFSNPMGGSMKPNNNEGLEEYIREKHRL